MVCSSCDKEISNDSVYCPHCGALVHTREDKVQMWDGVTNSLAEGCLCLVRGIATALIGSLSVICGIAATASFALACYLIYHFAEGVSVIIPWFLANTLPIASVSGVSLLLSGLTALLVTLLFGIAATVLFKCLRNRIIQSRKKTACMKGGAE